MILKALCIGDNNVDIYKEQGIVYPGGNCINVSVYMSRNGCKTGYIGVVGTDYMGDLQVDSINKEGVDTKRVKRFSDFPTANALITLNEGDRVFGEYHPELHKAHPVCLSKEDMEYIEQFSPDVIHSCYYSFLEPGTLEKLKKAGYFISYDYTEEWEEEDFSDKAPYVDIIFLSCPPGREGEVKEILKKLILKGAKMAVMTLGAKGSVLYDGLEFYEQEAYRVEPVDTMGAGDSFISKFLESYCYGMKQTAECLNNIEKTGQKCPDIRSYQRNLIRYSLSQAAVYAASNCMNKGAFGEGIAYRELS